MPAPSPRSVPRSGAASDGRQVRLLGVLATLQCHQHSANRWFGRELGRHGRGSDVLASVSLTRAVLALAAGVSRASPLDTGFLHRWDQRGLLPAGVTLSPSYPTGLTRGLPRGWRRSRRGDPLPGGRHRVASLPTRLPRGPPMGPPRGWRHSHLGDPLPDGRHRAASQPTRLPTGPPRGQGCPTHRDRVMDNSGVWPGPRVVGYPRAVRPGVDLLSVSYTHLRAHETVLDLVCRLLLDTKNHSTLHAHTAICDDNYNQSV